MNPINGWAKRAVPRAQSALNSPHPNPLSRVDPAWSGDDEVDAGGSTLTPKLSVIVTKISYPPQALGG